MLEFLVADDDASEYQERQTVHQTVTPRVCKPEFWRWQRAVADRPKVGRDTSFCVLPIEPGLRVHSLSRESLCASSCGFAIRIRYSFQPSSLERVRMIEISHRRRVRAPVVRLPHVREGSLFPCRAVQVRL